MPKLSFKINFIWLYFFILLMAVLFCHAQNTQAVETGNLGLIPAHPDPAKPISASWFIYEAKPGTVIEDAALIKNHDSNNAVTVRIYAVDGTTTTNGVFALTLATDGQAGIGAWVEMLKPEGELPEGAEVKELVKKGDENISGLEVTVPAGQALEIPFNLKVPENATVGDHTGGIIIEAAPKLAEGTGFNVVTRIGARVYLTVPGEKIFSLKIKEFFWNRVDYSSEELEELSFGKIQRFLGLYRKGAFTVKLQNLGNVQLGTASSPLVGNLVIRNIINKIVDRNEIELGTILPKGEIAQNLTWKRNNPFFLRYQANLEVTFAENKPPALTTFYFWVIPWPAFLIVGILIILIILIYLIILFIRVQRRKKMAQYLVQEGNTLKKISVRLKINPKKIVRINRLKFPYEIMPGQKLFIPRIKQEELNKILPRKTKKGKDFKEKRKKSKLSKADKYKSI